MKTTLTLTTLAALAIGLAGGYAMASATQKPTPMDHAAAGHEAAATMPGAMDAMTGSLSGKTGDAFDQVFLSEMIIHHQGAVAMAELAVRNAQHEELKTMAREIIRAQNAEIEQMKTWRSGWYGLQ